MREVLLLTLSLLFAAGVTGKELPIYLDDTKPIEERVEDALSRMTLEEKVALCHAQSKFSSAGVPRLGIPENWATDGPHGIRPEVFWDDWDQAGWTNDSCIAYPALTALAATWSTEMSYIYGQAIGEEARYRNKNILLGPGVNIYRTPLNGRNFEYMGEDPYLASKMVVPYIKGVQENGVAACVKHYALNNQEVARHTLDAVVDKRTLYEIYLPAFKASVQEGGAWAIMGSYNMYGGQYCCHNEYLLQDVLRKEWGFDGVVVSDWGGTYDTHEAAYNGLDMEFGTWTDGLTEGASNAYDNYYLSKAYLRLLKDGTIPVETVDEKVRNILRLAFRTTMDRNRPWGSFGTEEHAQVGLRVAQEGIVLLKNDNNLLPIDLKQSKKIVVIGENALKYMTVGGGSSQLKAKYEISPLKGIVDRVGSDAEVVYERGYVGEEASTQDGLVVDQDLSESRTTEQLRADALRAAKGADVVIFVGGLNKHTNQDCENSDREIYGLPYGQEELIEQLAEVNSNLAVVIISGNAVATPWESKVGSILMGWYGGSEGGNAIASVLVGDVNPSGKLPFSMPDELNHFGAHKLGAYPGTPDRVIYEEGLYVGYRWIDKHKITPKFPFGHGVSYTTFEYGKVSVNKNTILHNEEITLSVSVKNIGERDGAEVVQLYISEQKPTVDRPVKELKAFEKVYLKAGEQKVVNFTIDKEALSFYDVESGEWVANSGKFDAIVGASSTDLKGKITFKFSKK